MQWYYAEQGKQAGPVDDARLDELIASGLIRDDTLVWRDGMAAWQSYGEVRATRPPAIVLEILPRGAAASETRYCSQCGRPFPIEQLAAHGAALVCATCQQAGVASSGTLHYAGFWIRFLARLIDGIIMGTVGILIRLPFGLLFFAQRGDFRGMMPMLFGGLALTTFVSIALNLAYEAYFVSTRGATLGKMALGLKIVRADGSGVPLDLAVGRYFAQWVSVLTLLIGYIMAGFDPQKRALHDRICNTRVVHAR